MKGLLNASSRRTIAPSDWSFFDTLPIFKSKGRFTLWLMVCIFSCPLQGIAQYTCTPECNIPQPFSQCSFTIPSIAANRTITGYCGNQNWASVVTWNSDPQDIQNDVKIVGSGTITIPASNNLILKSAKTIHLVGVCLIIESGNFQFDDDNAKFVLEDGALILEGTVGSGSIQLTKNGNVFYADNSLVQVENGNIQVASGANNRFIFKNGTLRTFGDFNQDGDIQDPAKLTTVCVTNSVVEIGDEGANGKFNSTTNATSSANWTNIGGQRYLEDICLNVTQNFQLQGGGEDRIVDVCAEIGDQDNGSNNGHHYGNLGTLSVNETGNFQNDEGTSHIYHSDFIVAQNIQFGTGTTRVCDVAFANLNGNFQVQSGHILSGCGLCLWIVNGNIQSAANSNWTASVFGHRLLMPQGTNFLTTTYAQNNLWENGQNQSALVPNCFSQCCSGNPACDLNINPLTVSNCTYNSGTNSSEATLAFTVNWQNSQCNQSLTVTVKNSLNQTVFTETIPTCGITSKNYSLAIPANGTTGSIMVSLGSNCMKTMPYTAPPPCPPSNCTMTIDNIVAGRCEFGAHSANVRVSYTNAPTGNIEILVNGVPNIFTPNGSGSETFTLTNISCAANVTIEARFLNNTSCSAQKIYNPSSVDPADPQGFIYCEETGAIVSGGTVSVTSPANGSVIQTVLNGSTGEYFFLLLSGPGGNFNLTYTPPMGYGSPVHAPVAGAIDITTFNGGNDIFLGQNANAGMTALSGFNSATYQTDNPYYFTINIDSGDPNLFRNNIPVSGCTVCIPASGISFAQDAPDCAGSTAQNNGSISLSAVTNGTHYGVSTLNASSYNGPAFASATAIPGTLPAVIQSSIPNTGGSYIVRIFNGAADCFADVPVTVAAVTCTAPCALAAANKTLETCNNNGTTGTGADDYITFSLNPTGTGLGASYSVTANNGGTVTLAAGGIATGIAYGSATTFRLQNGSTNGTLYTITVTDVSGAPCTATTTVQQSACSTTTCALAAANKTLETCNNNGTTGTGADDYITFSLNPTGTGLGASYSVTANNGGTVTLAAGGIATGIAYGSATTFRLQNGSTNGTLYTITVTDVSGAPCTATTTVQQISTCSAPPPCALTAISFANPSPCNNNGTTANATDDYFTADITVTFSNPPATGNLVLTGDVLAGGGATSVTVATAGAGPTYTFVGVRLRADGTASAVTATFSADNTCTFSVTNGPNVPSCSGCVVPVLATNNSAICIGNVLNLATLVTGNTPAGTLTFYTSQSDATAATNALVNSTVAPIANTTYYVRSETAVNCFSTTSVSVTVATNPTPTVTDGSVCAGGSIDLATLVTSTGGGTLSFYTSLANANAGTNALASSAVSPASATNYYVRSSTAAGCYGVREIIITITPVVCIQPTITGPN